MCMVTQSTTEPAPEKGGTDIALRTLGSAVPHTSSTDEKRPHKDSPWLVQDEG